MSTRLIAISGVSQWTNGRPPAKDSFVFWCRLIIWKLENCFPRAQIQNWKTGRVCNFQNTNVRCAVLSHWFGSSLEGICEFLRLFNFVSDYFCPDFFLNLLLKRTGLSNTQMSLHVQTYYKEKQNLRFLTRLVIHIITYLFKIMNWKL